MLRWARGQASLGSAQQKPMGWTTGFRPKMLDVTIGIMCGVCMCVYMCTCVCACMLAHADRRTHTLCDLCLQIDDLRLQLVTMLLSLLLARIQPLRL